LNSEITDLAVLNEVVNVCEILKLFIAETYLVNTIWCCLYCISM